MSKDGGRGLENLIGEAERALTDMGDIDRLTVDIADEVESLQSKVREEELRSLADAYGAKVDAYVKATVSDDGMTAAAELFPAREGGRMLEQADVVAELGARGVICGLDERALQEATLRCNTDGTPVRVPFAARGTAPVDAVPEHVKIEPGLLQGARALPQPGAGERIDHKEKARFDLVKKGEVLARVVPGCAGKMGMNVRGEALPFRTARVPKLLVGKNTTRQGPLVAAACDGRFEKTETGFSVNPVLQIMDRVDYRTGHIKFAGDVIVYGTIQDGFKVHAGGSLFCRQTLDASEVICNRDLHVDLGIIGRGSGTLRVGGQVYAKFIENCYVEAVGRVYVQVAILNSAIHTQGRLDMGPRGIVVGGRVYAQGGVTAAQIGSSMGPRTEIYCGLDYSVLQRLEYIKTKNMELAMKLSGLKLRKSAPGTDLQRLALVEARIREAIHKLNLAARSLIVHLHKNDGAEIAVLDTIHAGAYMEICHVSYVVTRPIGHVRFYLDKAKGKILTKSL